jgi:hypothetical protein
VVSIDGIETEASDMITVWKLANIADTGTLDILIGTMICAMYVLLLHVNQPNKTSVLRVART